MGSTHVTSSAKAPLDLIYRKIFLRLLPFLMILWTLAWIDRVNIGFVKLTMTEDLGWSEAVYGLGAGIFFIGYFIFEVPSNLLLQKIGAKKTLMRITIGWGLTSIAMIFATTPTIFYSLRFLLGVFEAGFYPGIILYLTYWFPAKRRAKAFGTFMSASAFAGVLGGPLAGWIMNTFDGVNNLNGWQWVFIVEGTPSVLAGFVVWLYLTDRPHQAKWLTVEEQELVAEDLAADNNAVEGREHSLLQSLKSGRIWQFIAIFFCIISANSALTFFGPTLVQEVGFKDPLAIGWIMAAVNLAGGIGMILNGLHCDKTGESRWHTATAVTFGAAGLAGAGLLLNVSAAGTLLCLGLAIVGTMSAIPVFWQMPNWFLAGGAAAGGVALINSMANLAGFGAPFLLGAVKDSTGSLSPGLFIVAGVEVLAALLILKLVPSFRTTDAAAAPAVQDASKESEQAV
ncbi:MFS transporter [Streptomyces sp. NPDC046821]|uniref:MFS transporter n=1 Tax=Streptomyces sp. NPDC046821 TaxID=3154702 RepID=UPI0033F30D02